MEKSYGKDVQITLSWDRFVLLVEQERISKEELSQLRNRGRVLFTNHFVELPVYVRPQPKTMPKSVGSCAKVYFKPTAARNLKAPKVVGSADQRQAPWKLPSKGANKR